MSIKTKINSKGTEQIAGSGCEVSVPCTIGKNTSNAGFGPYGQASVTNLTSTGQISAGMAGVLVVSGDSIITGTLPSTSSSYGMMLTVRCGSAHTHVLSSSLDDQDNTNICDLTTQGSKLILPDVVGSSATLLADGVNWIVLGKSGSYTLE